MDINCTYNCEHQFDGKCNLTKTPQSFTSSTENTLETSIESIKNECLHYKKKETSSLGHL